MTRNCISFGKKYFGERVLLSSQIYIDFVLLKRVKKRFSIEIFFPISCLYSHIERGNIRNIDYTYFEKKSFILSVISLNNELDIVCSILCNEDVT